MPILAAGLDISPFRHTDIVGSKGLVYAMDIEYRNGGETKDGLQNMA